LPSPRDAARDDLLQVIAAGEMANLPGAESRSRRPLDQDAEELPDLVHVVSRLPFRHDARDDVARRRARIQRPRGNAASIALLPYDPEVAQLQPAAIAHE